MKLVYVRWRDARFGVNETPTELDGLAELEEVGFLIKDTDEFVVLSMEIQPGVDIESDPPRYWLMIPRVNIVEIRTSTIGRAFPVKRKQRNGTNLPALQTEGIN